VGRLTHKLSQLFYGRDETNVNHALCQVSAKLLPTWRQFTLINRTFHNQEKRIALSLIILCLISGSLLMLRWLNNNTVLQPKTGDEYVEGIVGTPRTANPLLANSTAELDLARLTHRGLLSHDSNGNLIGDLAQNWEASSDLKTYTVTLRSNLHWSDGEPLTAIDAIFTFQNLRDANQNSIWSRSLRDIKITAEGDLKIIFTLKEPYYYFPHTLTLGLIPSHVWKNIPPAQWLTAEANLKPIGSGPYRFKNLNYDQQGNLKSYVLEVNPFAYTKTPYLTQITLRFYDDSPSVLEALRQETIDGVGGSIIQNGTSSHKFNTYSLILPQYTAIFYNQQTNEFLANKSIRQGLSYAINRSLLIKEFLKNQAIPTCGPFTWGEAKTAKHCISFNLDKTKQLFESAGFVHANKAEFYTKNGQTLGFTLTLVNQPELITVAEILKQQLAEVGVKIELNMVEPVSFFTDIIKTRNYQALLTKEIMGLDPDPYPFWHSSQNNAPGLNLAKFQNREVDRLLTEARQTADNKIRLEKYTRFQEILSSESPATFLYSSNYNYILDKDIKNIPNNVIGEPADRFNNLEYWYRSTTRQWK
jgi:peptide/nickel transport system substrate-binding protein